MRRSHQSASSRPPASAYPEIAAIVGLVACRREIPSGPSALSRRPAKVSSDFRSAPAQNACSPAPVSTSTRTSGSDSKRAKASCSATAVGPSTAFRRCGRSIVISAVVSRRSYLTGG